jgi:hypothetical protein
MVIVAGHVTVDRDRKVEAAICPESRWRAAVRPIFVP